jgi:hypothetical protein
MTKRNSCGDDDATTSCYYEFQVKAENAAGRGAYSDIVKKKMENSKNGPVQNLETEKPSLTGITVKWKAPSDDSTLPKPTKYTIEYKLRDEAVWSAAEDVSKTALKKNYVGLISGSQYDFRVTAVNVIGSSITQEVSGWTTAYPERVYGLATKVLSATKVQLTFRVPGVPNTLSGDSTKHSYKIQSKKTRKVVYGQDYSSTEVIEDYSSTEVAFAPESNGEHKAIIDGLSKDYKYKFQIKLNDAMVGDLYETRDETNVFLADQTPDEPTNLVTSLKVSSDSNCIKTEWTAPAFDGGQKVDAYGLRMTAPPQAGKCNYRTVVLGSTITNHEMCGLDSNVQYQFTVFAANTIGVRMSSTKDATSFKVPRAPHAFTAKPRTGTAVTLNWIDQNENDAGTAPRGGIKIRYKHNDARDWVVTTQTVKNAFEVQGLAPQSKYQFQICFTSVATDDSAYSSIAEVLTANQPPEAATGLDYEPSEKALTFKWTKPASDGGHAISQYEVWYRVNGTAVWTKKTTVDGSTSAYKADQLSPAAEIEFKVRALTAHDCCKQGVWGVYGGVAIVPYAPTNAPVIKSAVAQTLSIIEVSWDYEPSYNKKTGKLVPWFVISFKGQSVTVDAGKPMKQNITVAEPTVSGEPTTVDITVQAENVAGKGPKSTAFRGSTLPFPPTFAPTISPTPAPPPAPAATTKKFKVKMQMTMKGVTVAHVRTMKTAIEAATAATVGLHVSKCTLDMDSIKATSRRRLSGNGVSFKVNIEATEAEVENVEAKVEEVKGDPSVFTAEVKTQVQNIIKAGGADADALKEIEDVVDKIEVADVGKTREVIDTSKPAPTLAPAPTPAPAPEITSGVPSTNMMMSFTLLVALLLSVVLASDQY